jgi:hypothetical protein
MYCIILPCKKTFSNLLRAGLSNSVYFFDTRQGLHGTTLNETLMLASSWVAFWNTHKISRQNRVGFINCTPCSRLRISRARSFLKLRCTISQANLMISMFMIVFQKLYKVEWWSYSWYTHCISAEHQPHYIGVAVCSSLWFSHTFTAVWFVCMIRNLKWGGK